MYAIRSYYGNLQKANFAFHQAAHHSEILPVMVQFEEEVGLTDTDKIPQIIEVGAQAAREQLLGRLTQIATYERTNDFHSGGKRNNFV